MHAGERILLTLWIGGMWTVGYVVVPTLFDMLDSRILAGAIAGRLFTIISGIGILSAVVLIAGQLLWASVPWRRNWRLGVLAGMLVILLIGQFGLQPQMAALKAAGLADPASAAAFGRLHGISSALFLVNSLLGLVLVIFGLGERAASKGSRRE